MGHTSHFEIKLLVRKWDYLLSIWPRAIKLTCADTETSYNIKMLHVVSWSIKISNIKANGFLIKRADAQAG